MRTKIHTLQCWKQRNTPVDNYKSQAELAVGRQLRSVLPVNLSNFKIKTIDNDEFKESRRKDKKKQSKYYDQHTKEMGKQWEC